MPRKKSLNYCLVKNNETLRRLIERELKKNDYTYASLSKETGIDSRKIKNYIERRIGKDRKITQLEVLGIAAMLGFMVELKIQKSDAYPSSSKLPTQKEPSF